MAELIVEEVTKTFPGGRPVLDRVGFSAAEGEFVALLGPSGCGKTTLLRIVAGLERQDSGRVLIGGRDVGGVSPKDRDIAFVFQTYALYPHMTVAQNIGLALELRGVKGSELERRVGEAAARLGLSELLARRPAALSGGQRQRVALARALVREPKAFLLDEPLSNLDAALRERTRGELKLLFKRVKGTVVYVTHDQLEAMTLADRIVLLNAGRVEQQGTPEELYRRPASVFAASFLGSPAISLVSSELAQAAGLAAPRGTGLTIGVRPEDVEVSEEPRAGAVEFSVALAEPTGPHTVLTLERAGATVRALAPASWNTRRERAYALVPPESLHVFDAATGRRRD